MRTMAFDIVEFRSINSMLAAIRVSYDFHIIYSMTFGDLYDFRGHFEGFAI